MTYITVQQAALAWSITERRVQKYCTEGRIAGARRFGRSWQIPANAPKPEDARRPAPPRAKGKAGRSRIPSNATLMPLMNTPFRPGECRQLLEEVPDGPAKEIATAEYLYFSGRAEQAVCRLERYLTSRSRDTRLSACLLYAFASLSGGCIPQARRALAEVQKTLAEDPEPGRNAAAPFVAATASVLLHLPLPDGTPPARDFLPLLPPGLRAFALYVQAHYLYLREEYQKSIGMVEATLAMGAESYPIPAIYLHLVAVMDYMSLRCPEQAQKHLLAAWDLARPDDLIEGFGEHHGLLGGMLEAAIKPQWPEDFKRIIEITYRFSAGWRKIHNPDTGDRVADNLSTTEFAMAMLAARGWTNQEIAAHMNMSSHTVKRYLSHVMQKLNITHRQDLKQYMLQ
ncbi:helix-turn-helix transcriptional regulator [Gemmiger formicilis]|uniref:helix-turn-helix domain-containing protein n=1 Tax=Gemmiger formicilis TaxID=745368 RepID=UPI00195F1434|nr:LuxR C-terminal-related transcriptional regulator [Gemmiger formicilis]MBM6715355.1 helix-turn-helix transcriptional regulator [Gemmiger formicilis]